MPESTTEVLHSLPFPHLLDEMLQISKSYNKTIMEINQTINAEQEAQQKEYKRVKDAMKADIKQLSTEQITTKFMRASDETLTNSGISRNISQSQAQQTVHLNGVDLRHLFIAYAIFRHILNGNCQKNIPEVNYEYVSGKIVRKDGKAIRNDENAPRIELITKILEKYGASNKSIKQVVYPG